MEKFPPNHNDNVDPELAADMGILPDRTNEPRFLEDDHFDFLSNPQHLGTSISEGFRRISYGIPLDVDAESIIRIHKADKFVGYHDGYTSTNELTAPEQLRLRAGEVAWQSPDDAMRLFVASTLLEERETDVANKLITSVSLAETRLQAITMAGLYASEAITGDIIAVSEGDHAQQVAELLKLQLPVYFDSRPWDKQGEHRGNDQKQALEWFEDGARWADTPFGARIEAYLFSQYLKPEAGFSEVVSQYFECGSIKDAHYRQEFIKSFTTDVFFRSFASQAEIFTYLKHTKSIEPGVALSAAGIGRKDLAINLIAELDKRGVEQLAYDLTEKEGVVKCVWITSDNPAEVEEFRNSILDSNIAALQALASRLGQSSTLSKRIASKLNALRIERVKS